jgi:hypothetical protein
MNAFALHDVAPRADVLRWGSSAASIVALHAVLVALAIGWATQPLPPGVTSPVIMVDMAPVTSAPQPTPLDLAPGPVMQQADASPPEPARQDVVEEQLAPTPPQDKPEVVAPPEQKVQPAPARARARESRSGREAGAGQTKGDPCGGEAAGRGTAGASVHRLAAHRTSGARRFSHQQRCLGVGYCILQQPRPRAFAAFQAISAGRESCRPAGGCQAEFYARPQRPGARERAWRLVGGRGARLGDIGNGASRPAVSGLPA